MENKMELVKKLEARRDITGLKNFRNYLRASETMAIDYAHYILSNYTDEEIEYAWIYPNEAPQDLRYAIITVYCNDTDILMGRIDEAMTRILDSTSNVVVNQDIWDKDLSELPDRFEDFLEQCTEAYSDECSIPVDELYETFVYLSNYKYEQLNWSGLINNNIENIF